MVDLTEQAKQENAIQIERQQLKNKIAQYCHYGNHQPLDEPSRTSGLFLKTEQVCEYCRCKYIPK